MDWASVPRVVAVKRFDDPLSELLLEVPAVIGNAEQRCHAARILDGVERAAAAVLRRFLHVLARPLLQGDADDVMALGLQEGGRDRRIDPAGHRDCNFH